MSATWCALKHIKQMAKQSVARTGGKPLQIPVGNLSSSIQVKVTVLIIFFQKTPQNPVTHKAPFFSLLFIVTLAEKKQDTPGYQSVLFHLVLKAYPTQYS